MLSQITWTQFWMFISSAVPAYYLIIILVYFRSEASTLLSGKFIVRTTPAHNQAPISNFTQVIGAFEEEPASHNYNSTNLHENTNYPEKNGAEAVPADIFSEEDITPISYGLSDKLNHALLTDAILNEEFLERVNKELEEEQLMQNTGEIIAEFPLEDEPWIDAEDFFQLIEQGIDSLPEEKRSLVMKSSLYQELFEPLPDNPNQQNSETGP